MTLKTPAHRRLEQSTDSWWLAAEHVIALEVGLLDCFDGPLAYKTVCVVGTMGIPRNATGITKLIVEQLVSHDDIAIGAFDNFKLRAGGQLLVFQNLPFQIKFNQGRRRHTNMANSVKFGLALSNSHPTGTGSHSYEGQFEIVVQNLAYQKQVSIWAQVGGGWKDIYASCVRSLFKNRELWVAPASNGEGEFVARYSVNGIT